MKLFTAILRKIISSTISDMLWGIPLALMAALVPFFFTYVLFNVESTPYLFWVKWCYILFVAIFFLLKIVRGLSAYRKSKTLEKRFDIAAVKIFKHSVKSDTKLKKLAEMEKKELERHMMISDAVNSILS